jgi:FkbM family methyltransferase
MIHETDVVYSCMIRGKRRDLFVPDVGMAWSLGNFMRFLEPFEHPYRILDVGGCCGAFAVPILNAIPKGTLIAIEPSSWSLPYLRSNAAGLPVTILKVAASDKWERLTLSMPPKDRAPRIGVESVYGSGEFSQEVQAAPIDDLVKGPIDFIKIDVEGHEIPVIRGAKRLIAECHPQVLVELKQVRQEPAGHTSNEVIEELVRMGYGLPRRVTHHDYLFEWPL